jgi:hypothetical protein
MSGEEAVHTDIKWIKWILTLHTGLLGILISAMIMSH